MTAPASGDHPYPAQAGNPVPHGGDEGAWRAWADHLTVLSHFGVRCRRVQPGEADFVLEEHVVPANPNGSLHGGVVAAVADDTVGAVFVTAATAEQLPATVSLTVDYLRPAFPPVVFEARVTGWGRTLVHCETTVIGRDGKVSNRVRAILAIKRSTPA